MANANILFDLPTCLVREICGSWLSTDNKYKAIHRLDLAACNKNLRPSLLDAYHFMEWESFLVLSNAGTMIQKMKWVIVRKIQIPSLAVSHFPNDLEAMKAFFKWTGRSLKVLKLTDFRGAMTMLTKVVAVECKVLETLCVERCNLTVPIADFLNRSDSIKEVRLQNRTRSPRFRNRGVESAVKTSLLERIACRTVTKLALLDQIDVEDVEVIVNAFPNITDIEIIVASYATLAKLLFLNKNIEVLRLTATTRGVITNNASALFAAVNECKTIKKVVLSSIHNCIYIDPSVLCAVPLRSITTLSCVFTGGGTRSIAESCNETLEVLMYEEAQLTIQDVTALAEHCPNLRVLHARRFIANTNYAEVLKCCTKIEELRFSVAPCTYPPTTAPPLEEVLALIVAHCANLEVLGVSNGLGTIQAEQLQVLCACPKLRVIEFPPYSDAGLCSAVSKLGFEVRTISSVSWPSRLEIEY